VADAELDDVDIQILALLEGDARLSARAISRRIGMSANAVSERIERLQQRGVIAGFHAHIDPEKLGYGMLAIVGLETLHGPDMDEAVQQILAIPEVEAAHIVTGRWDLVIEVRARDPHNLQEILLDKVWKLRSFRHSETLICLSTHQATHRWAPPIIRRSQGGRTPPR
jgi:Lrp/AsnC family transcriptional regulator, regulator for asnA, asnC and gidA